MDLLTRGAGGVVAEFFQLETALGSAGSPGTGCSSGTPVILGRGAIRFTTITGKTPPAARAAAAGWMEADLLRGGAGGDVLPGGDGRDKLSGGSGADAFVFLSVAAFGDLITDFATGQDQIRMTKFAADLKRGAVGQFVLRDAVDPRYRDLIWDGNGSLAGGKVLVLQNGAGVGLLASDLLII